ncbi:carbohydrate ABC transporter permease [uncultured Sphaerochaeta sp.]|uniref:carbohydrate ABC transporter permease n=1 Tax=uncultured Sphaerochaeta sp. TaxID=886478 RepID=UPI0029CA831F|nr:carbohydrate ABC transporter permease [uncultured Sphaerochaeta sp.]
MMVSNSKTLQHLFLKYLAWAMLLLGALTMVLPFVWMISTSLKHANLVYTIPPTWIPNPVDWENYRAVWEVSNLATGLLNSAIVSLSVVCLATLTSSMAAFAFSKLYIPYKQVIFTILLTTMMIPVVVLLVPQFILYSKMKWIDTLLPLIVPASLCNINMIFFLKQYLSGLPKDLLEAAKIDGASYFGIYWRIYLPLMKTAIVANTILLFMATWNDYFAPLIFTHSRDKQTVQVAIAMMNSHYAQQTDIPLVMAASLIAVLPVLVLFIICQKYFVDSFAMTGIKG